MGKREDLSILLVVAVTSFMGTFLVSAVNIALPTIEKDLALNAIELSWIITAFILAMALFMLPSGSWGDRSDNRRLFKLGLILFTISSGICYVAPDGHWLVAARFLQGIGAAFTGTTGQAILVSSFPAERRGQVLGISVASVYGGLALGPLIGGFITLHIGWRSLFLIAALFGLLTILISYLFLKSEKHKSVPAKGRDKIGTLLFMTGLAALVYGSSLIPSAVGWGLMSGAVILLLLFWRYESRITSPMLDTKLFSHNRLFTYSSLSALINYTSTFAIVFFLSLYLQKVQGLSPRDAGAVIVAQPAMMALFSPIVGRLSDKIQPRYFATTGMAMCTTGLGMLAFLGPATAIWIIVTILIWVGLGFALFSSPNMNTIMSSVERRQYGQASGLASSMRVFGQIISMSIVTLIFSLLFGSRSIEEVPNPVFLQAMRWGFIIFTLIGLPGIYFSFNRGNLKRKE
ncbi:drug resistance transporter [Proteiniphilum saccharofermentans]|uniref:Drug resistance transporter n=1 Tax=Proteiniphilum saccharofermentans TaxID=1642647 RepID=A0A1R3SX99_9BACT|nr:MULTISPECIES: MFS transporter [Proteiniphilum]MDY9919108.1 MFS transporter [Proteiniphilum sp.]SCD20893.1 drug resistance transporter [Proteiniphilum saccharofermentans]